MRLHRLSLTAFGPFAGTEEVDFDEVGRDGLFLLWGPTGAGTTNVPPAAIRPNWRFAVRGSKRSEVTSQNPEPRIGPSPEMCRYTSTAASFGDENVSSHSRLRSTVLTANAQGTNLAGESRDTPFAFTATRAMEKIEVAMTIAGSEVTSI